MVRMLNLKKSFEAEMIKEDEPVIEDHLKINYLKQMKNYKKISKKMI